MTPANGTRARLRLWVQTTANCPATRFDDATPLFASGLLDSTDFVALLLIIEEALDGTFDPASLHPESFRSIDTICNAFFTESADAGNSI